MTKDILAEKSGRFFKRPVDHNKRAVMGVLDVDHERDVVDHQVQEVLQLPPFLGDALSVLDVAHADIADDRAVFAG